MLLINYLNDQKIYNRLLEVENLNFATTVWAAVAVPLQNSVKDLW